ncbi:MAG TPA: helix-turn-helix domain-containing protein [Candidatus Limnocylindria bacterium]|nr:helix-turn-helix domain-containing protein [Candidatus Limnocylindria bacterium]
MAARADEFVRTGRAAREIFLTTGRAPSRVRQQIEASWRRSSVSGVRPELRQLPDVDLVELNGRLYVAAKPVLQDLGERLGDTSTSVMLADRNARVITRWVSDHGLRRRLDRANSVDGASLHEEVAGTNGLGSVLVEGIPVEVKGPEHYIDAFQGFSCVGAPVRHPLSGQIEGVVTLAVRYEDSNELLLPLAVQVAEDIQQRMLLQATARERMLLDTFLSVARRSTRPVVAVTDQLVITNPAAARLLDGVDHALLWEIAANGSAAAGSRRTELPLSGGEVVSARVRPVDDGLVAFGAVIEIDPPLPATSRQAASALPSLPGMAGNSAAWQSLCSTALRNVREGRPMVISGERGTGKVALLMAALSVSGKSMIVVDAAMEPVLGAAAWVRSLHEVLAHDGGAIIRHVNLLGEQACAAVCAILDDRGIGGSRMLATCSISDARPSGAVMALIERLGSTLEVPALRSRREDIPDIVAMLARRHAGGGPLTPRWNSDAMHALMNAQWPGNVRELESVVRELVGAAKGGEIRLADLPNRLRHRVRQPGRAELEQAEIQAIRSALAEHGGNKQRSARALGISRSTLYRKLESFGPDLA